MTTTTPLGNSPKGSNTSTVSPGSLRTVTGLPAADTAGSTIPICGSASRIPVSDTSHRSATTVSLLTKATCLPVATASPALFPAAKPRFSGLITVLSAASVA